MTCQSSVFRGEGKFPVVISMTISCLYPMHNFDYTFTWYGYRYTPALVRGRLELFEVGSSDHAQSTHSTLGFPILGIPHELAFLIATTSWMVEGTENAFPAQAVSIATVLTW